MQKNANTDLEIKRAAQLSITEIGLGSLGHGFKIPLTGQILSLNQLAFLLNALNRDSLPRSASFEISSIAAVLKSFSPAGNKLGPMLSIAMQGFLFWLSTSIFGLNIFGQIVGAVLLSLWAFIQPLISLLAIYGFDLVNLSEFYIKRLSEDYSFIAISLVYAIATTLILKILIAIGFVIYSHTFQKRISLIDSEKVNTYMLKQAQTKKSSSAFVAAFKDMFKPIFLLSFVLLIIFIWQMNGSWAQKIWLLLRPLAIAYVLFYLLRSSWVAERLTKWAAKSKRAERIYTKAKAAFDYINQRESN